ncbi:MAG TPA: VIT domain-containing protein, partial [Gemmatimonadales bacterium]|nr:VIT domain-containing protein [Gemmatimonadales bacterium]
MTLDHITMIDDADPAHGADEEAGFGYLQTARGGLPLQRLAVDGRITGLLYRLTVTQTFVNVHAEPLEATYIFPLPARAGVTRFQLHVGERVIDGVLKERGAARTEYDRALHEGRRAAIAEEERPEVFTVRAGNIPPGETVGVELELVGPLAVADGEATFRFPLVVAPRYIPGIPLEGPSVGLGTAPDTDAVPDASRITPPVLLPGQPNPVALSFRLELDPAGLPLDDLRSSLHVLHLSQTPDGLPVIELTPGAERLDRDVILRFRVGADAINGGLSVYRDPDGETTALLTVTPPATLPATFRPRDVVVLLDRSGSMGGWKIAAARRAAARLIDTLTDRDRFGLILFDNELEEPAPSAGQLVSATDRARFRAVEFLARVEARGGTEIAPALTRALQYFPDPPDAGRERILLFVTDGQVGNEDHLLRQVQQHAQHCR